MAINKRKILASAQKHLQKGALDKALRDYQTVLEADPRDANVRLKVGDLLLRQGQRQEAFAAYLKVADQFMREGFDAKAVALYKQIAKIDPTRFDVYLPLADLYQRLGLVAEAMNALQTVADHYHREGRKSEALDLLRRMASLDPTNTTSRLKIAELLRQAGRNEEAFTEYQETAGELERQGDWESQVTVLERMLEIEPRDAAVLEQLTRVLMEHDQAERSETFARRMVDADPAAPEGYELLAEVYRRLGREEEASQLFRQLADVYRTRGDEDKARDILQRYVQAEPLDLGSLAGGEGDDALQLDLEAPEGEGPSLEMDEPVLEESSPELDTSFLEESGASLELEPTSLAAEEAPAPPAPEPAAAAPPSAPAPAVPIAPEPAAPAAPAAKPEAEEGASIEQLLAEAAVYVRYGKQERAITSLLTVLRREPEHPQALDRLADACTRAGSPERAGPAFAQAAEAARARGDEERFAFLQQRLAALDPEAAELLAEKTAPPAAEPTPPRAAQPEAPPPAPEPVAEEPAPEVAEEDAAELGDFGDIEIEVETDDLDLGASEAGPAAVESAPAESPAASGSGTTPEQIAEDLDEAGFYLEQGMLDEAEAICRRILKLAPSHPQALLRLGEIAAARGKDPGDTGDTPAMAPAAPAAGPDVETTLPEDLPAEEGTLPDDLGLEAPELDLDVDPVREPAAEPAVEESAAAAPEAVAAGLEDSGPQSLELDDDTPPALADEPPGQALFDLAAELNDVLDDGESAPDESVATDEDGFHQLFREFKRGVSQTLGESDRETRYDLGIAYREMGLLEDAIGEFRLAAELPDRRLEALYMMGLCHLDLGRAADAASSFEQALGPGDVPPEREIAIRFDLARAYEEFGDRARALETFRRVAELDPDFQDVASRIAALESPAADPAAAEAGGEEYEDFDDLIETAEEAEPPGESFESFEDLMAEVEAEEEKTEPASPPPRRRKISFV